MNNNSTSLPDQFHDNGGQHQKGISKKRYMPLLLINYTSPFANFVSSSFLSNYYFNHKGSNKWVSPWVQSAGFPLLFFPIFLPYYLFKCTQRKPFTRFIPGYRQARAAQRKKEGCLSLAWGPPPIISIQSHSIRNYREAKYHFHEPQLRHPIDV